LIMIISKIMCAIYVDEVSLDNKDYNSISNGSMRIRASIFVTDVRSKPSLDPSWTFISTKCIRKQSSFIVTNATSFAIAKVDWQLMSKMFI